LRTNILFLKVFSFVEEEMIVVGA
jgi:hypothetical protein